MSKRRSSPDETRELRDRLEILELCARYTHTGNAHDAEGHAATFTSDGVLETIDENGDPIDGWVMTGPAAVAELVRRSPPGPVEITSDPIVEIDGDGASGSSSFLFGMRTDDRSGFRVVTTGRYRDRFRRTEAGWRIARRTVQLDIGIDHFVRAMADGAGHAATDATAQSDLQRLLDIEEIKQLKARYFRCIDRKLWSEWHTVFAPDAVTRGQGFEIRGLDTIVSFTRDRVGEAVTVHHGHQVEIWFDDARRARAIWAMQDIVQFDTGGEPQGFRGYGHYEDSYVKLDVGWRIASCELVRHLTHKLPGGYPARWLERKPGAYGAAQSAVR